MSTSEKVILLVWVDGDNIYADKAAALAGDEGKPFEKDYAQELERAIDEAMERPGSRIELNPEYDREYVVYLGITE